MGSIVLYHASTESYVGHAMDLYQESGDPFTTTMWGRWVNATVRRFCRLTEILEKASVVALSSGTATLPTGFVRLREAYFNNQRLDQYEVSRLWEEKGDKWNEETGDPTCVYLLGLTSINSYPIYTGNISVLHAYWDAFTGDSDTIDLGDDWVIPIALGACELAARRDVDSDPEGRRASMFRAGFIEGVQEGILAVSQRLDVPRYVNTSFVNTWLE